MKAVDASNKGHALWRMLDQMRGKVPLSQYADVLAPLAALLFLRWAGKQEEEQEAVAAFDGTAFEPSLPAPLHWEALPANPGETFGFFASRVALIADHANIITANLPAALEELVAPKAAPLLEPLVEFVGSLPFETPGDRGAAEALLADVITYAASKAGGHAYEFITPPAICELMTCLADPQPGDRIYDPCFGFGGLLVHAAKHLRETARQLPPRTWLDVSRNTFYGVDMNRRAHLVGLTRLLLLGFERPGLQLGDTLLREPYASREKFSCIVATPPWSVPVSGRYAHLPAHYRFRSRNTDGLFIQHIADALRPGGRAVILMPNSFLSRSGIDRDVRKMLLQEFDLEGVLQLPEKSFMPYTAVVANLLVLRKQEPNQVLRFLKVDRLAGIPGARSGQADVDTPAPAEVAKRFRLEKPGAGLQDTPVSDLALNDWNLQVQRYEEDGIEPFLKSLQQMGKDIVQLPLGEVAEVRSGISYSRHTTTDSPVEGSRPLIRVADVSENLLRPSKLFLLPDAASELNLPRLECHPGDLVVTTSGTIGKAAIVDEDSLGAIPSKSVAIIRTKDGILPGFIQLLLSSAPYNQWMQGHAGGSGIRHLSVKTLRGLVVPVPPVPLQAAVFQRWFLKGGDGARILLSFLRDSAPHPLTEWLDTDAVVARFIKNTPTTRADRLPALERLAATIQDVLDGLDASLDDYLPPVLQSWRRNLVRMAQGLNGLGQVPDSPARFSMLNSARQALTTEADAALWNVSPEAQRAKALNDILLTVLDAEINVLLTTNVIVSGTLTPGRCHVGEPTELMLRISNHGGLPLRNFTIRTTPDCGQTSGQYLPEWKTFTLPIMLPAQTTAGVLTVTVDWACNRMDDSSVNGTLALPVQVLSTRDQVHAAALGKSPYNGQNPVIRKEMFFGREKPRNRIQAQLEKEDPAAVILLLGNRRMGKTSILNRLRSGEWLPGHVCVYCSFQGISNLGLGSLFRHMANMIGQQVYEATGLEVWHPLAAVRGGSQPFKKAFKDSLLPLFTGEEPLVDLEAYIESVLEALGDRRLLLMLDEFDKAQEGIDAGITNPMFPDNLRYIVHTYRQFSLMLVGSPQVRAVRNRYWSALFGLGETIHVGALERNEARSLVTDPVPQLAYTIEATDLVVDLCACRANLIQKFCDRIFTLSKERETTSVSLELANQAAEDVSADNEHFATLWDEDCRNEKQRFILCLCARMTQEDVPITYGAIESYLERANVRVEETRLAEDIEHLCDAEILRMDQASGMGLYRVTVPLMLKWLNGCDFDVQQRKALQETMRGEA